MTQLTRRHWLGAIAALLAGPGWAADGAAHFIVPYPPGGVVDVIAREFQAPFQSALGQPVIVDNVPGAAGAIGLQRMLSSPKTGEVFAFGTDSDVMLVPLSNPAVSYRPDDLRMIGLLGSSTMVLVVGAHLSGETLASLLDRSHQPAARDFTCGNVGVDSNMHLIAASLSAQAKVGMVHVPYKGIAPLVQDLMGGHIDMAFLPFAGGIPGFIETGKLRAIGVAGGGQIERLPNVPTIASVTGLPDFSFDSWSGVFVARAMSDETVHRLNKSMQLAVAAPGYRKALNDAGVTVAEPMRQSEADAFFRKALDSARLLVATNRGTLGQPKS